MGEDESWWVWLVDGPFFGPRRGVLTSSVFIISFPLRVTVWTSLSSLNLPLALIFFGFEASDIVGTPDNFGMNKQSSSFYSPSLHMETPLSSNSDFTYFIKPMCNFVYIN